MGIACHLQIYPRALRVSQKVARGQQVEQHMGKGSCAHLQRPSTRSSGIFTAPLGSNTFVLSRCRRPWGTSPGPGMRWEDCQGNFSSQDLIIHLKGTSFLQKTTGMGPLESCRLVASWPTPVHLLHGKDVQPLKNQCSVHAPCKGKTRSGVVYGKKGLGVRLQESPT